MGTLINIVSTLQLASTFSNHYGSGPGMYRSVADCPVRVGELGLIRTCKLTSRRPSMCFYIYTVTGEIINKDW